RSPSPGPRRRTGTRTPAPRLAGAGARAYGGRTRWSRTACRQEAGRADTQVPELLTLIGPSGASPAWAVTKAYAAVVKVLPITLPMCTAWTTPGTAPPAAPPWVT